MVLQDDRMERGTTNVRLLGFVVHQLSDRPDLAKLVDVNSDGVLSCQFQKLPALDLEDVLLVHAVFCAAYRQYSPLIVGPGKYQFDPSMGAAYAWYVNLILWRWGPYLTR